MTVSVYDMESKDKNRKCISFAQTDCCQALGCSLASLQLPASLRDLPLAIQLIGQRYACTNRASAKQKPNNVCPHPGNFTVCC
jgi:hypothetical protein